MRTTTLILALLVSVAAQAEENPRPEVDLGNNQVLVPGEGPAWNLVDKASGKVRPLVLPAFHPEYSVPVVQGNRLAYVGHTQRSGKFQLDCITYDLTNGKVLNRQVSELYAREGQVIDHPRLVEGEATVTCRIAGDRCTGKNLENCAPATENVTLDFEPGSLARRDLKGTARKSAKGKGGKATAKASKATKATKATKANKGKTGRTAVKKAAGTGKTKPVARATAKPSRKAAHR